MSADRGYYLMQRGWMYHPFLDDASPFTKREAWIWIIEAARYQGGVVVTQGQDIELSRGQLCHSFRYMARAWGWSEASCRRFVNGLKQRKMIDATSDAGQTVITIWNYEHYQTIYRNYDAPLDAPVTQERRANDANKKTGITGSAGKLDILSGSAPRPQGELLPSAEIVPIKSQRWVVDFLEFYQEYPRKVGRGGAEKAYRKALQSTPHEQIMAGLRRFRWPSDRTYIPHPATWLNKTRWLDEPEPSKPKQRRDDIVGFGPGEEPSPMSSAL